MRGARARCTAVVAALLAAAVVLLAAPAQAADDAELAADVQAAAQLATAQGYRTGVAVLDLETGTYYGAGEDTAEFASESVVKVLLATELLLDGKMTGATETTAYEMITQSDDEDADELYWLAGGDDVVDLVAAHYGISDLGSAPARSGWWGNTGLTAKGLAQLYAAIAADDTVGPWLENAMAHATEYGSDGTYQFFGLPSATTGAAVKQGWGDDGDDSPNAVFNTTGFVDDGRYAVVILTDGPSSSYGSAISAVVTAQAQALLPGGTIADDTTASAAASSTSAGATASSTSASAAASSTAASSTAASSTAASPTADDASGGTTSASGAGGSPLVRDGLVLAGLVVLAAVAGAVARGIVVRHR